MIGLSAWIGANLGSSQTAKAQVRAPRSEAPPSSFDMALAEATFDSVWSRVESTHYDPELGDLDWDAVRDELRPQIQKASSAVEVREILGDMLSRLGESHFGIISGASAPAFDRSVRSTPAADGHPGLDVRWVAGSLLVSQIRDGSPAEQAGVTPGWIVDVVDGMPVDTLAKWIREAAGPGREEQDLATWLPAGVRDRLLGPEGTPVELSVRDDRDEPRNLTIPRVAPPGELIRFGNLPPLRLETEYRVEQLEGDLRVGIIRLSAWFPAAAPSISEAIDQLREVDGIVLDLRGNPGGIGALVMGIGGHFLDEPMSLGTMHTRETRLQFVVNPQRVTTDGRRVEPYTGPLAILVDPMTGSTSEIFAGGLQALGRATIIGENTAGQALPALVVSLPNGDRLMHAVADFTGPDGARLEGIGVRPDVLITLSRAAFLREEDPVMARALRWMQQL